MKKRWFTLLVTLFSFLIIQTTQADQLCRAALDCPINYSNDTVRVPYNVVMLSEIFEHCSPDSVKEGIVDTTTDTISLFIVIDHSSSMSKKDPKSNRYKIARDIIDTISKLSPASEIGMAVFSNKLMHNNSTDSFFKTLESSASNGWNDAYVPLTKLDSQINGTSAVEKLKWSIDLDSVNLDGGTNYRLVNGYYETSGRYKYSGGTDISLGFEAAKEAFLNSNNIASKQFILFLSDGDHDTNLIDDARLLNAEDYIAGQNTPTTYTAFFITTGQIIPQNIKNMTTNIQNNGYSSNNFSSKVWSTESEQESFLENLFTNIIGDGLKMFTSTPKLLVINNNSTTTFDSSYAYFNSPLAPLNIDGTLELNVTFTYQWDSPINEEVTREFSVFIMQDDDPDLDEADCWEQGTISFYYTGTEIMTAQPNQTNLQVRYYPSEDSTAPSLGNSINVVLKNADNSDSIVAELFLNSSKTFYSADFIREYATPANDSKLQNQNIDSLIAIFRNELIPLDTVRHSIPVMPLLDMTMQKADYYDTDANGHPDEIRITQAGGQVLTQSDCNLVKQFTKIYSPREVGDPKELVSESYGFSIDISQKADSVPGKTDLYFNTNATIDELVSIKYQGTPLSSSNELPFADLLINDSMAPVINSATYFDLPEADGTDTLKICFSEKTGAITSVNPFHIVNPAGDTITPAFNYLKTINDTVIFTHTPTSNVVVGNKDSIWINSEGGISDTFSVYQTNPKNIKRPLKYYRVVTIQQACYLDNSDISDGLIDEISFKTNYPFDTTLINSFKDSLKFNPARSITINGFEIHDSSFSLYVSQPLSLTPVTSTDSTDVVTIPYILINQTAISSSAILIKDSLPPVVIEGFFTPGYSTDLSTKIDDTLQVVLSEKTTPPPYSTNQPFNFLCSSGDTSYYMSLNYLNENSNNNSFKFAVTDLSKPYPQENDSLNIEINSNITDMKNIIQTNSYNRFAPLKVTQGDLLLKVTVTNNPSLNTETYIADGIEYTGIGVKVIILGSGWPEGMNLLASLTILDEVGNIVNELSGVPMNDHSGFWFHWNGCNKNQRFVHSGSYLGLIRIKNQSEDKTTEEKIIIGIKEKLE